jgi:signal transduction histidine kinase
MHGRINGVGTLSFENAIIAIASLVMLSTMSGLLFAVLVQPHRGKTNLLFALFCLSLLLWSLVALAGPLPILGWLGESARLKLLSTAIGLSSLTFFLFIIRFVSKGGKLAEWLLLASPVVLAAAILIIWTGNAYTAEFTPELTNFSLLPLGYVALGAQIVYALVAFWMIISSPQEPVRQMRLPGLLMILVYVSLFFEPLLRVPLGLVLATTAAARVGWVVLRLQLFNPMTELSDELRIANRDLRQMLGDLSAERLKTEILTRQLEAASRYRSDFLDNLGHRLRTPLNSIVGYSQLLQSGIYGELNAKQTDRMGKLHRNTNMLLDLINHMLDLNAMAAGKFELDYEQVSLNELVRKVFEDLEPRRAEKHAVLSSDLPSDLQPVYGDEKRITQVLRQLVDNALKFTLASDSAAPEVSVKAVNARVEKGKSDNFPLPILGWLGDGNWVVISVTDPGIGIMPEEQGQIFDEFFQTSDKRAAELGGTGLGLAITKRLVELHEGVIWLKSAPEQGSTFFVAFRVSRAHKMQTAPHPAVQQIG